MRRPILLLALVRRPGGRVGHRDRAEADRPGPRPPGRRRGRAAGQADRAGPGHPGGHRPLGGDHPRPRRRVRRCGARDPDPGRRSDRRRAAGRGGPGAGRQRPDQPGTDGLHPLRAQHRRPPGRHDEPLRGGQARREHHAQGGPRAAELLRVRPRDEGASGRPRVRPGLAARGVPEQPHPRQRRGRGGAEGPLPGVRGDPAVPDARVVDRDALARLPEQPRPDRPGRQLGRRPPRDPGLGGQPLDRDDGLHRRRPRRSSRTSRGRSPSRETWRGRRSGSRSSSTERSSPTRRSTSTTTPAASTGATAPRSRGTSARTRRRPWRPRSTPARCRSSSR